MAELVPLKAVYNGSNVCGLSELRDGDVVGVEHGGLGVCTLAANSLLIGNTQGSVTTTSALTNNGQIIIGGASGPAVANLSGTSNEVDITNGDGTIQIGLPAAVIVTTSIKSPAICVSSQYALPAADGSAGQIMCTDGSGALSFVAFDGSGHCIAFGGSTVTDRTCLNFVGGGVTVSDNSGTNATDITIPVTTPELKVRNTSGTELGIQLDNTAIGGELICDTTPQLGGTLDVNGYAISSVSDGNIAITPHGDGAVVLDGLSWPIADGTAGYILCTNGSGGLAWAVDSAGGSAAGSNNEIQYNNSGSFGASSNLTFDSTTLTNSSSQAANVQFIGKNTNTSTGADRGSSLILGGSIDATGYNQGNLIFRYADTDIASVVAMSSGSTAGTGRGGALRIFTKADNGSNTERLRIDHAGNVGIGTATPDGPLHVQSDTAGTITAATAADELVLEGSGNSGLTILSGTSSPGSIFWGDGDNNQRGRIQYEHNNDAFVFATAAADRLRIDSAGRVGIANAAPSTYSPDVIGLVIGDTGDASSGITLATTTSGVGQLSFTDTADTTYQSRIYYNHGTGDMGIVVEDNLLITADSVGIGTATPDVESGYKLHVIGTIYATDSDAAPGTFVGYNSNTSTDAGLASMVFNGNKIRIGTDPGNTSNGAIASNGPTSGISFVTHNFSGGWATRMSLSSAGTLSKSGGSFNIEHPLESKKETHKLVHSFVEGPRADLIYRGTVDLVSGTATVNIDTESKMTDGTFVALNTNSQSFTSNESGFSAIKSTLVGNVLTITAEDVTSTDTISWAVIGERNDTWMIESDMTDADGRVIVEPEIEVAEAE